MQCVSILASENQEQKEPKDGDEPSAQENMCLAARRRRGHGFLNRNARCAVGRYRPGYGQPDDISIEDQQAGQLLRSLGDGDAAAFWELWDLYKTHLYHLCLWQMGGVREDAEDALSRAMLRALDKLPSNERRIQNIRAWLSKLTLNICVDMHREQRRRVRRLESIEDARIDSTELALAGSDSPEEGLLNREVFAHMCHAVEDLPPRLREPFVLRFFQEMAYGDIAECLILSTENVRKRIQQARDILRLRLQLLRGVGRPSSERRGSRTAAERVAVLGSFADEIARTQCSTDELSARNRAVLASATDCTMSARASGRH